MAMSKALLQVCFSQCKNSTAASLLECHHLLTMGYRAFTFPTASLPSCQPGGGGDGREEEADLHQLCSSCTPVCALWGSGPADIAQLS